MCVHRYVCVWVHVCARVHVCVCMGACVCKGACRVWVHVVHGCIECTDACICVGTSVHVCGCMCIFRLVFAQTVKLQLCPGLHLKCSLLLSLAPPTSPCSHPLLPTHNMQNQWLPPPPEITTLCLNTRPWPGASTSAF